VSENTLPFHFHLALGAVNRFAAGNADTPHIAIQTIRIFGPVTFPRIDSTGGLGENGDGISAHPPFCRKMTLRSTTKLLLTCALGLPVIQVVLIWVAGLLKSMGDEAGATIIRHVGTGCQVIWSVSLVGLVIILALMTLNNQSQNEE
jgi:hypothetical protein